jgi:hypothetical protein
MFLALSIGMFPVLGTSFLSRDTRFLHCIIAFFYSFSGFHNMKKQKKKNKKKRGWERVKFSLCLATVMSPLNKALSFESSSHQIGF